MSRVRPSPTLISVLLGIALVALAPCVVTNSYALVPLTFIAIYTILVIGLNMLMGYAGQVSLGHAAFFAIGAYTSAILSTQYGCSLWAAMPAGMELAGIVALLVGMPCLRLRGHYLAMATLGFGMIVYILLMEWPDSPPLLLATLGRLLHLPASTPWPFTGGASGLPDIPALAIGSFVFHTNLQKFYLTWAFAILALLLCANIVNSRVGRALRAVHGSEAAAATLGVNIAAYKIHVFVLSAILAALAGSLYAHAVGFISPPTFNFIRSVDFVVMVVIGGMASIWGAVLGAGTIVLLGNWLQDVGAKFPRLAEFDLIIHSAILILVMIFMPAGIVCTARDAVLRRLRGRATAPAAAAPAHSEEVATP